MSFFLSSCVAAQNFQSIKASHSTSYGGVKGARAEKLELVIKENPQLQVKYLLVGNVKIILMKKNVGRTIQLNGIYFPEQQPTITSSGENVNNRNDFNLKEVFLISEDLKKKKEIAQRITFTYNLNNEESIPTDDVPE
ncbi:hypothetical protein [Kaistella sp.]|uniref:hypothetical protein n=1 Tax=Kaistella sp. TaxID=2782235 RepID=UPI0035A121AD